MERTLAYAENGEAPDRHRGLRLPWGLALAIAIVGALLLAGRPAKR